MMMMIMIHDRCNKTLIHRICTLLHIQTFFLMYGSIIYKKIILHAQNKCIIYIRYFFKVRKSMYIYKIIWQV